MVRPSFILLTTRGGVERNPAASRFLTLLGNVTFLERPFHPTTLVSLAQAAARARRRQYTARETLVTLRERETTLTTTERTLRNLNEHLEARVEERTRELMNAEETLRQAQKMEAIGQLTGGLAHDFNNMLGAISGNLQLLARRISQNRYGEITRYIENATLATERAAALTQKLLAFSRRQTLSPRATDVARLIEGMKELVRGTVGPSIDLAIRQQPGLWNTLIDASQLENAVLNLCINARDAMNPDGGRITIDTANTTLDGNLARDAKLPAGDYVSICVSDTGTGMPPDIISRAFEPFYTTKPLGHGTGLGLSMVYGFALQSGGQVKVESVVGEGTTMCLYLPRHMGHAVEDDQSSEHPEITGNGEVVLVIDDEPPIRAVVAEILAEAGYKVLQAGDGPSGLRIIESDARIDLLITDVGLPNGMNGRQVADAAREKRPSLKILFITGYAQKNAQLEPGMEVLTKPFNMMVIRARVQELMAKPLHEAGVGVTCQELRAVSSTPFPG